MTSSLHHGCMNELSISMRDVLVAPRGHHCGGVVPVADTTGMGDSDTWAHVYMHRALRSL